LSHGYCLNLFLSQGTVIAITIEAKDPCNWFSTQERILQKKNVS
jgi:hypothetical protein